MQKILIEKPYRFIPPYQSTTWSSIIQRFNLHGMWLRRAEGVVDYECRGAEHLRRSLQAGHGVLLTPNHCRPGDPIVMGWLAREVGCHVYAMASWHLFHQDRFSAWAIRRMGGFSVYREGIDRAAVNTAVQILEEARRPLIIFPEGAVTRTNDRLHALLDGVAFIARTAAKRRARQAAGAQSGSGQSGGGQSGSGRVVVHPVALKYRFLGDLRAAVEPVLAEIEHRFSWRPQSDRPLLKRINRIGYALLCLKEIEHFGQPRVGDLADRLQQLIDRLLGPLEDQWLGGPQSGPVVPRVKALRMKIMPDMVNGQISAAERQRRWGQLADIYLAQQVSCYPPDYLVSRPSVDRMLETVERYEEDLTDRVKVHGNLRVIISVGPPLEVPTERERGAATDPLMVAIEQQLQAMLDELALESPLFEDPGHA